MTWHNSVTDLMQQLQLQAVVSTHFLEFARALRRQAEPRSLVFLQAAIDASKLPTYQFEDGVANSSLAQHVAARLGVTRGELQALISQRQKQGGAPRLRAPLPSRALVARRVSQ